MIQQAENNSNDGIETQIIDRFQMFCRAIFGLSVPRHSQKLCLVTVKTEYYSVKNLFFHDNNLGINTRVGSN